MATRTFSGTLQNKTGTAAAWASVNPTLPKGQIGVELDTNKIKVGDGVNAWNSLNYIGGGTGQEIATQDEVTAGTVANKVVTPATAAGCYLRIWQGTTAPTDLSGRTAWLNTNTDPAALYYYNTAKSAWQSAVAYAAGAGTSANANYVNSKSIDDYLPLAGGIMAGPLTLAAAPTADLQSATKGYVDTAVSGVGGVMSSLLAKNGYIKFGNGVLVQWGVCTISKTVSFPIPFSSTNYSVVVTPTGNNESGYQNTRIPTKAQGSFYVAGANWSDGNWVAIGY